MIESLASHLEETLPVTLKGSIGFGNKKEVFDGVRHNIFGSAQENCTYISMPEFWFYLGHFSRRHLSTASW